MDLHLFLLTFLPIMWVKHAKVEAACVVDDCKLICGSNTLNLNPISELSTVAAPYTYFVNPCSQVTAPACKGHNQIHACQVTTGEDKSYALGYSLSVDGDPVNKNVVLNFASTQDVPKRSSSVKLTCADEDGKLSFKEQKGDTTSGLVYIFDLHTRYGCLEDPSSNNSGGLSAGSVLVILFFVFVLIYIVGGIIFLKFIRRSQGTEIIPNVEFWKDFPLLVRDGVRFTCRGCKAETSYEKI